MMKLNATPLVSTENMPEPKWHEWRRKGIGGSDVAAILGLSPFATCRDIYYTKKGIKPAIPDEDNWVAKEVGHRLEELVSMIFTKQTGLPSVTEKTIFAHTKYPFMLANLDYLVELPDGTKAILECKTSNIHAKEKWANDSVPINYELQCRHYMAVMDINVTYIACLFGNNENDFIWRRIDRDFDYEADIIEQEKYFWDEYVQAEVEPPYMENGDLVLNSIRKHYGHANTDLSTVELPKNTFSDIEQYLALKEQKSQLEKVIKDYDNRLKKASAVFLEQLGAACEGICRRGNEEIQITYKPIFKTDCDEDGLKATFPDIHRQFFLKKESYRRLNIKRKEVAV